MGDIGSTLIRNEGEGPTQQAVRNARNALRTKFRLTLLVLAILEILLGTALICTIFVPKGIVIASRVNLMVTIFIDFTITIGALMMTRSWTEDAFNKIDKE